MNILLFYQHIDRELYSINKLKYELEKENGVNAYIFSIDFEMKEAVKLSKKIKIDIVVTPWMYHTKNYEEFVAFVKSNPLVKIVNLHQEQISSKMSERVLLPTEGVAKECVYHLAWGENFKQKLLKIGTKENLIYLTGNMRNDEMFIIDHSREEIAQEFNLDLNKKWILYAENQNWVRLWSPKMKYEWSCKGISDDILDEYYSTTKDALDKSIDDLNRLPDAFFERYEIIYRLHPGMREDISLNKRVRVISTMSIYDWLHVVDICVVWSSTCAFESDAVGIPVIVCEPIPNKDFMKTDGLDEYTTVRSVSEIEHLQFDKVLRIQKEKAVYKRFYSEVDGKACERVSNAILQIAKTEDDYLTQVVPTKFNIQTPIYFFILRLLIKLNLFEKLKFPRSAYAHKNDIPFYKNKTN